MTRINTNVSSIVAQKTLARSNSQLQEALTRLSTGLRINVGKDDPAGLIASEVLRSDITGTQRAITNSERANQLISTADSALGQVSSLLNDIRGLVSEAANTGALSEEQIDANQLQVDASLESIDRIARVTSFQGRRLLDGSLDFQRTAPGNATNAAVGSVTTLQNSSGVVSGGAANTDIVLSARTSGSNYTVRFIDNASLSAGSEIVSVSGSEITVQIRSGSSTAANVISAINAQSGVVSATASGASGGSFTASFQSATRASARITGSAAGTDSLTLTALSGGTAANVTIKLIDSTGLSAGSETVTFSGGELQIQIRSGVTTGAQIISAINAQSSLFSASGLSGSTASAYVSGNFLASAGTNDSATRSFLTSGGGSGNIVVTAENAGAEYNDVTIRFTSGGTAGSETVSYNATSKVLNITIQDGVSTAAGVVSAINAQTSLFTAALASGSTSAGIVSATASAGTTSAGYSEAQVDNISITQANFGTLSAIGLNLVVDRQATQAQVTYSGTALNTPVTLKIAGNRGNEVRNFGAGTSLDGIAEAINLVSDSTGVSARVVSGSTTNDLVLTSIDYGSDAYIETETIGNPALFQTYDRNGSAVSSRITGTDVQVRVNGVTATARGLDASINTAQLDLSFTISSRLTDGSSVNFTITGGGAKFQIGPDVVSNQQARLGIQNVSTVTLGGPSGKLYELRTGEVKSLRNDATAAGRVVDEVISSVTSLRGRLGAFQKTTLDTNILTLNDTLENLISAESSIRDADFAAESAKLTRAQILVQSGTSVLAIANQSPQGVLSLLR